MDQLSWQELPSFFSYTHLDMGNESCSQVIFSSFSPKKTKKQKKTKNKGIK
jgi:hypothetical protein